MSYRITVFNSQHSIFTIYPTKINTMKKLAYSLLFLSFGSFAQLQPGYHPEQGYAYEDFGIADEYPNLKWSNLGTHDITIDSLPAHGGTSCIRKNSKYSFTLERNPNTKTGSLIVNQPYASYSPVNLDFGRNTQGRKNVLDLSKGNAFVSFQLKNTSDSSLRLWIYVMDSTGHMVNSVGRSELLQAYNDFTEFTLSPGQSIEKSIDLNANAYETIFNNENCHSGLIIDKSTAFNSKVVSGIGMVVQNRHQNSKDSYKSYPLTNIKLQISGFAIGSPFVINALENERNAQKSSFYPNPATNKITFSEKMENIILKDMSGNVALQTESATELNLSTIAKGIYFLSSSSLTKPTKVIVK